MAHASPAARGRGAAAGVLTAALATLAHTSASGTAPSGAAMALLGVLALTIGAFAATADAAATARGLLALLAAGQVVGHVLLGAAGHDHGPSAPTGLPMVGAHVAAVLVGALLIAAAGRLGAALSRTVRAVGVLDGSPSPAATATVALTSDQPLQSTLMLAFALSHRGPPAVVF